MHGIATSKGNVFWKLQYAIQGSNRLIFSGEVKMIVTYCRTEQLNMFLKFRGEAIARTVAPSCGCLVPGLLHLWFRKF